MTRILSMFYLILFLGISAAGLYISYHILRYSISKQRAALTMTLFASVFILLLATNATLFFRINWDTLIGNGIYLKQPTNYSRF
ncbi:MAG: hypothetical protein HGA31_02275 [Candidatus Moranbacteria bacterium]|nr:hypothetical protein [Candidatus Moranbacteria bacterium]